MGYEPPAIESNSASQASTFDYPAILALNGSPGAAIIPRGSAMLRHLDESASDPSWLPADEAIRSLCQKYDSASPEDRDAIRAKPIAPSNLDHFAKRMAIRALRTGKPDYVRLGLQALSIDEGKYDFRDILCSLAMLKHSAEKTGIDFRSIAEPIVAISSEKGSQLFLDFLCRSEENNSLAAMGQTETSDRNGMTMKFDEERTLEHVKKFNEARSRHSVASKLRTLFGTFFGYHP